jgi:hypothetical protein
VEVDEADPANIKLIEIKKLTEGEKWKVVHGHEPLVKEEPGEDLL